MRQLDNGLKGLCGETGECMDLLKKHEHQGHPLHRDKLIEELGDVMWYIAEAASSLNVSLEEVAKRNIDKLRKRYPDGFEVDKSVNRKEQP